ncbi:MAG: VacJ family lipoprotein [Pseudomonadota bacterium]
MPNAALMFLTSPLLIGEVPEAALTAPEPAPMVAREDMSGLFQQPLQNPSLRASSASLLSLDWSLIAASQNVGIPQDQSDPSEAPPEDETSQDEESDENVIVVTGGYGPPENDPIERINEESYRITQDLDNALVEPIAYAYRDGLPGPLRDGLSNAVNNLREPNNALNFLLQGKIGKTFETLGRLLINSTLGIGGLIDVAEKPGIGLPFRRNGWANTMGFYGVGSGPYLFLPVTGATSARDVTGSFLDQLLLPVAFGEPFNQPEFTVPFYVVSNLDDRLEFDAELKRIDDTINPYAARRDSYLYRREVEIAELRGEEPPPPPDIMEEVEGTGDFADPPEDEFDAPSEPQANTPTPDPKMAVIITRPR